MGPAVGELPAWARWAPDGHPHVSTLGVEEEVMLLDPTGFNLAQAVDEVLPRLDPAVAPHAHPETHAAALELSTGVHDTAAGATAELRVLRDALRETCGSLELGVASAGTHPFAVSREIAVSQGERQAQVYGSMRELARREPTFALHVHVGVPDADTAIRVFNRLRVHLPALLALSANSPFWQGRDTGLASARTPLFQAFPRVGIPRPFESYEHWASTVDLLVRCEAFPEPTFLWWDVRLQPRLGTIEVRIMDAQVTLEATSSLVALVQCLARLEASDEAWVCADSIDAQEVIEENRFLAARDGVEVELIDVDQERRVPLADHLDLLLPTLADHAQDLGCTEELAGVRDLLAESGAKHQLALARDARRLPGLVSALAEEF